MWIDQNINEEDFQSMYNTLFNEQRKCSKCDTVDKGIEELMKLKYEEITIIISGRFFLEFYKKFNKKINEIKVCPIVIVFCQHKELFISNLRINNIYNDNDLLSKELIFNSFWELKDYLNEEKEKKMDDLTFDEVEDLRELIIPSFYSYLIQDVTRTEILFYNQNIISNYHDKNELKEKKIKALISQLKRSNLNSKGIISKYWLRIYTMQSDYCYQLNKDFRKKNENLYIYDPFIKICYEGIRKKFLNFIINKKLFRGTGISKKELQKYIKKNNLRN